MKVVKNYKIEKCKFIPIKVFFIILHTNIILNVNIG